MRGAKVLLAHNLYQQPGGEDEVFSAEAALLEERGHRVLRFCADNRTIPELGKLRVAKATLWNSSMYRDLRALFRREAPSVAHFHNTFPLISPAAYYAARHENVPVVQTLHNFRIVCPNGLLFRHGRVCSDCLSQLVPWPAVVHSCYRNSRQASAVVATMLTLHRALGTWTSAVTIYVALTQFARQQFIAAGLPGDKIFVKPNFLSVDPGVGEHKGKFALFVGRLSGEKGLATLLNAWGQLGHRYPLKVVGSGPLERLLATPPPGVEWLGRLTRNQVVALMRDASFLVFPSECYEGFPVTLVEAFATGLPVIASAHGSTAELVRDFHAGRLFEPGDANSLAATIEWAITYPDTMMEMGRRARREFETKYTADHHYASLMNIYRGADERARGHV